MKDHERGMSEMPLAGKGPYERSALFVFRTAFSNLMMSRSHITLSEAGRSSVAVSLRR